MDAANSPYKQVVLLLLAALLVAVPGYAAATIQASSNSVLLTQGGGSQTVTIASLTGSPVSFTPSVTGNTFFTFSTDQNTTPSVLTVSLAGSTSCILSNTCSGTITLTPSTGDVVNINVALSSTGGGTATVTP